ncbi:signal peptidase I [Dyella japonica]|uniref:Signal peptidase I n=1 Tax=Dyella japonica A8 TaxID=1217721 RepID=A0A075K2A7_9GAMM|nr:signal peptidase I [Dyella japonica]AIF48369.1 signal peptidase [Dyella japonica A8]
MRRLTRLLADNKGFLTFMLCMFMFRSAVADWNVVPTGSMQPTIEIGDRILVDKAAYDIRLPFTHVSLMHRADPQRGDIVVLDSSAAGERLVKRVIGVPGDQVALIQNRLYVNGKAADYRPIQVSRIRDDREDPALYAVEDTGGMHHAVRWSLAAQGHTRDFGPVSVPAGHYLLLGDNRDNSADSRYFGFFPRNEITGRATRVAMSLDPDNHYLPRKDRWGAALR